MEEVHKVKPLPFAYNALDGISEQQLKFHHDVHYAAYVKNETRLKLSLKRCGEKETSQI